MSKHSEVLQELVEDGYYVPEEGSKKILVPNLELYTVEEALAEYKRRMSE